MMCRMTVARVVSMTINLETAVTKYLKFKKLSRGTSKEYRSMLTKWLAWGKGVQVDQIENRRFANSWNGFRCVLARTVR